MQEPKQRTSTESAAAGQGTAQRYALTIDEERALIARAQQGDRAAMERIVTQYRPLVLAAGHRRAAQAFADDAVQAAAEELVRTIYAYDTSRSVPFASYAKPRVHGAVSHLLTKNVRSWQRECATDEPDDLDRVPDLRTGDAYEAAEARATLAPLLAVLTDDERRVLHLLYYRGLSTYAAARELGWSQSKVCQRKKAALAKMKEKARGFTET